MNKKIIKYSLGIGTAVVVILGNIATSFADATTTLANATTALDNLEAMIWQYVNLGITRVWPLFLTLGIVAAVIAILVALYHYFSAKKSG